MNSAKPRRALERNDYRNDDERWGAVRRRDARADGEFYFSVKTTGVYCSPSCAARRALRKNVVFHDSAAAAERAGYRACKRCLCGGRALADEYVAKVAAACRSIETAEEPLRLEVLARAAAMSRYHFHRVFTRLTGLTPGAYARARRAERARQELARRKTVTEAIYQAGFNSNGRFYAESARILGMKPGSFRRAGAGETIRFALGECSLGSILVAASARGICAVSLGDRPEPLLRELQESFPKARMVGGDRGFEKMVAQIVGLVEEPRKGLALPLDIRGTVFQRRVWKALGEIPAGSTASYAELARRIGLPKAVRAVAGACAANRIAVAIPCHRVRRTGGALAGYRWGIERKRALLARETSSTKSY